MGGEEDPLVESSLYAPVSPRTCPPMLCPPGLQPRSPQTLPPLSGCRWGQPRLYRRPT